MVRNETAVVDLDQLKGAGPKICKLTLQTDIAGAAVYVDGKQITVGEALEVTYGTHRLSVIAEGYESWEKTLVVNSESATISLDMEEREESTQQQNSDNNGSGSSSSNSSSTKNSTGNSSSSGGTKSNSSTGSSNSKTELSDTEVDYLTTISNMLTKMLED